MCAKGDSHPKCLNSTHIQSLNDDIQYKLGILCSDKLVVSKFDSYM